MTDTPTPPAMTPEQRAGLADLNRELCYDGIAKQLEADGDTIATLTAERDAAQAEIARLTAANATAREDGMREALAIIQDISLYDDVPGGMITPDTFDEGTNAAYEAVNDAITKGAST